MSDSLADVEQIEKVSTKEKMKRPKKYNILFHNDDYTSMEFVTWVLETIFDKTENEAYDLMITVHNVGKAIVATETKEIAEQKVYETKQVADLNNYSWFTVTIEQVSDD